MVGIGHGLGGDMQYGAETGRIILDLPRFGGGDVLVDVTDHAHCFGQRILLAMVLDQRTDGVEGTCGLGQQGTVLIGHRSLIKRWNLTEVLVHEVGHTIHQIAPGGGELLIVMAHELGPGEVGVRAFRTCHGDVVAHASTG